MDKKTPACYDICCGAGVFSLGFKRAGFKIIGGIDIENYAIETAKHNIPEAQWANVSIEEFSKEILLDKDNPIYQADVIVTGLPCQGFSSAGNNKPNDERNELYRYLLIIAENVRPKFVVIENVKGLLTNKYKKIFFKILRGLRKLGYDTDHRIYDAANFSVPQHRKRVFIIAALNAPARFVFDGIRLSNNRCTVRDGLKGLNFKKTNPALNHTFMQHGKDVVSKIKKIKRGALKSVISYRCLTWDKRSLTIVSGHNALPLHPKEHRAISNREAARLQGIPDTFIFKGSRTEQTVLVANAVPLPLAQQIANAIKNSSKIKSLYQGRLFKKLVSTSNEKIKKSFRQGFVAYYKNHGRKFPWRKLKDPYKILITEILLQRTKGDMVQAIWHNVMKLVKPSKKGYRFNKSSLNKFVKRIGLFGRTEVIRQLNTFLAQHFKNNVPKYYEELMHLPGVGIYIASAVRTFAFGIPDFPVDANAFRFVGRFHNLKIYGKKSEARQIREFMNTVIPKKKCKEFAYGFLDFCSAICSPKNPKCKICFLNSKCRYNI